MEEAGTGTAGVAGCTLQQPPCQVVCGPCGAAQACIGVAYGYAAPGELEAAGADCIVKDLAALEALLLE